MALTMQERAAEVMEHMCRHDGDGGHGYSQVSRYGDGTTEVVTLSDGTRVTIAGGDRDCSSGIISAFEAVGVDCGGATYTGNMRSCMCGTGNFAWHPMGDGYIAQRGDVYLNERHHTAMCTSASPDTLAQFSISETGGVDGREGDQTGWESNIRSYYSYPWDGKLVYVGPQPDDSGDQTGDAYGMPDAATMASWIRDVQRVTSEKLHAFGLGGVTVDGVDGPETQRGVVRLYQASCNCDYHAGLDVDGIIGPATLACVAAHPVGVVHETSGNDVWCVKAGLTLQGWDVDLTSWSWSDADAAALAGHQQWHGLDADGVCGAATMPTLLPLASA